MKSCISAPPPPFRKRKKKSKVNWFNFHDRFVIQYLRCWHRTIAGSALKNTVAYIHYLERVDLLAEIEKGCSFQMCNLDLVSLDFTVYCNVSHTMCLLRYMRILLKTATTKRTKPCTIMFIHLARCLHEIDRTHAGILFTVSLLLDEDKICKWTCILFALCNYIKTSRGLYWQCRV